MQVSQYPTITFALEAEMTCISFFFVNIFIHSVYCSFFKSYLFIIYLAAPGLSSAMQGLLAVACKLLVVACGL